jgi:hypothetical protein
MAMISPAEQGDVLDQMTLITSHSVSEIRGIFLMQWVLSINLVISNYDYIVNRSASIEFFRPFLPCFVAKNGCSTHRIQVHGRFQRSAGDIWIETTEPGAQARGKALIAEGMRDASNQALVELARSALPWNASVSQRAAFHQVEGAHA